VLNLPNAITAARIAATPLIAALVISAGWQLRLTAWVLFILAAVTAAFTLLAVWLSGIARRRLLRVVAQRHLCFNCGYDLRGNPAAPCPECGWQGSVPVLRD